MKQVIQYLFINLISTILQKPFFIMNTGLTKITTIKIKHKNGTPQLLICHSLLLTAQVLPQNNQQTLIVTTIYSQEEKQ